MTTYKVVSGDTIWQIAKKHDLELNELLSANPQITNPSLIFPGQIINIPDTNKSTYTIKPGDTMWSIAAKKGIELNELLSVNPQITIPSLIFPGQVINIPTTPTTSNNISELENEVIRLVNIERTNAGKPALSLNSELSRVARIKSEDFVKNNYFSHYSPTYGSPFDMMKNFVITFTAAAEYIASGQRSAKAAVDTWMKSSGHRDNILNPAYNQTGVGVARDNKGNLYWTQMFIKS